MKGLNLIAPINRVQLEKETLRIYEICDGCRRCFNLCPSFNTLLDRIDVYEGDVTKLTQADHHQVVDECYYCKLCFNHCPYTPPHHYEIDFPHLMVAWKKRLAADRGVRWRDRVLTMTDRIGRLGSFAASPINALLRNPVVRQVLEILTGLHRDRQVLRFSGETFVRWFGRRRSVTKPAGMPPRKVALFPSCLVNYQVTDIGKRGGGRGAGAALLRNADVRNRRHTGHSGGGQDQRGGAVSMGSQGV
jgi:Fe-S oxidoreductase